MENNHRFERKNRGNRMTELAKDEGKMVDDEIFKEDSSDDDFNPEDVKNFVKSSSAEENEEIEDEEGEGEGDEEDDSDEENESEEEEIRPKSPKKKKKKEEEILDIDQLDIDKIDMIEDLKDRGIDIDVSDEEELEKRMREYNEESENEEVEEKKEEKKTIEVVKKKRGRKSKKELEMMRKKRGRKKKIIEKDDNIFLSNQTQTNIEVNNNKIIIENIGNNIELEEEEKKESNIQSGKSSKIKKSKKDKINRDLGINPDQFLSNYNQNIISEDNFILTISKHCLTESIPEIQYSPSAPPANLDYIELNNYLETPTSPSKLRKKQKNKLMTKNDEKNINTNSNYNNSGIIEINNNNIIINKKYKNKSNEINFNEELNTDPNINNNTNDIIGHKRTRYDNNLIDLFKKQKKEKPNKNVTIVGNRENPKYIYISKKILDENDEEKEIKKEEKKKKKKEKEKEEDKEKEKERINFDLEQELDAKNIIMKFKQQEKEKKQFGLQNKYISQEQRLLESIFTELTNKQSLKSMQKLEDLNKRENYLYTSKKTFKDYIKITNSERHILEDKDKNKIEKDNISINNNISQNNINANEIKNEEKKDLLNIENENNDNEEIKSKINSNITDNNNIDSNMKKTMEEEYKEKEKNLNKVRVTFTNKEYFRIFNNLNKKPIKDKKEKICVITGKPAKYFDPLTKNYYSTVEAFKILRERYYQNEEDRLLFKIQTLSDLASQKKERLKKMIMSENEKPKEQIDYILNNNEAHKNNSIKIDSETMSIEENNENNSNKASRFLSGNSALMKMINKFGLLKNDGGNEDKKVISHRIYNRNRENCVDSGMLLEANKVKLIISKKIFKDKYSSKLPAPEMTSE